MRKMTMLFLSLVALPSCADTVNLTVSAGPYTDKQGGYANTALELRAECQTKHPDGSLTGWIPAGAVQPNASASVSLAFAPDGVPSDVVTCRAKVVAVTGCQWATPTYCESDYVYAATTLRQRPGALPGWLFK